MKWIGAVAAAAIILAALAGPALAMSVDEVIQMLKNGVGEQVILDQMAATDARFDLSTQDILDLKSAGAPDDLLQAMIKTKEEPQPADSLQEYGNAYDYPATGYMPLYYDPFGYNWYSWPYNYSYYDPFLWSDVGFYYAGFYNPGWWAGGPRFRYYHDRYSGARGNTVRGRNAWGRGYGGAGRSAYGRTARVYRAGSAHGQRMVRSYWSAWNGYGRSSEQGYSRPGSAGAWQGDSRSGGAGSGRASPPPGHADSPSGRSGGGRSGWGR